MTPLQCLFASSIIFSTFLTLYFVALAFSVLRANSPSTMANSMYGSQTRLHDSVELRQVDSVTAEWPSEAAPTMMANNTPLPEFKPGRRLYGAIISLCTVILVVALDATSLSVALPIVSQDLGGTAIEAFWSGTSFLLTSTVFQPNFASLSHIFGRKPLVRAMRSFFLSYLRGR